MLAKAISEFVGCSITKLPLFLHPIVIIDVALANDDEAAVLDDL